MQWLSVHIYFIIIVYGKLIIQIMNQVVIKVIGNYSYQTSKCLGQGVYGKVYEGVERQSKEKVAIKKIDLATFTNDKYLQNAIFSEIYLLKRFNHPNIVKFKDVLSSKNSLYIITEFCKNGDLKQLMKRKKFKEEEVFEIMRQILNGFSELIREKIVHRDLKPANILINEGIYKIGDFGFAKYVDNFGSQMLKSCVGSPIYMAPQILQRSQYTTKCDIWSLGVIFYEMMFGYPPWKARDENQLLRGIKTISITHILKRSNLSAKANDFLKKTLAYSEQQRIGWIDLFQMFSTNKSSQKQSQTQTRTSQQSAKQRTIRVPSNNNTWSQQQLTPQNNSFSINNYSNRQIVTPSSQIQLIKADSSGQRKAFNVQAQQIDNATNLRQFCIFYHYYLVQLYTVIGYIKTSIGHIEHMLRLFYSLSLLIKYKSTYGMSIMSIHYKNSKQLEDLYKKMKAENQTYQILYNDIISKLEKEGLFKKIKGEITDVIGYGDIISEEKTDKIQTMMVKFAHQMAQVVSDQVRRKAKNIKDFTIVEILENMVDLVSLGLGKGRALRQLRQDVRAQDEDLRDYVTKVISKLDKITSSI